MPRQGCLGALSPKVSADSVRRSLRSPEELADDVRSADPQRNPGGRLGHAPLPGGCRGQPRPDRRNRPHIQPRRRDDRRRRHDRRTRLHRRPHPHGCAGGVGSGRHLLVLARRDQRGHGQLRVRAGALQTRGERVVRRVPGGCRGHPQGSHGGRHRLVLGDLPRVSRGRRIVPEGHQLRRLHRALGSQDVRDGRSRSGRGGRRGRSQAHGEPGAGGASRRRRGPVFVQGHHAYPPGRRSGGKPHRQLGRKSRTWWTRWPR